MICTSSTLFQQNCPHLPAPPDWQGCLIALLVYINILQRLRDQLLLGFLEQLLEFRLQHLRLVLLSFDDLLILFVVAGGFFL
jgi:hypothetical protein